MSETIVRKEKLTDQELIIIFKNKEFIIYSLENETYKNVYL